MKSDSETGIWDIPLPGKKPPPGQERAAWLDSHHLYRNRTELHALLDSIDPALRENRPATLDPEKVAIEILLFLEKIAPTSARPAAVISILRYLHQGFNAWCRKHGHRKISVPMINEFSLDAGLLDGNSLSDAENHREWMEVWQREVIRVLADGYRPNDAEVVALLVTSATLIGGLATPGQLQQFAEKLSDQPETSGTYVWFDLEVEGNRHRWIADPVTEALLRRFTHLGCLPLPAGQSGWKLGQSGLATMFPDVEPRGQRRKSALLSLESAVRGMLVENFPPDVVSVALEAVDNTSLPTDAWLRLICGVARSKITLPEISVKAARMIKARELQLDLRIRDKILDLNETVSWNAKKKRAEGIGPQDEPRDVRDKYIKKVLSKTAELKRDILQHYRNQGRDGSACYSLALCHFVEDLIHNGGPIKEELAPSTIDSYYGDASRNLNPLEVADMRELDVERRQDAYLSALTGATQGTRSGVSLAIQLFERTLLDHLGLEDEVEWSALPLHTSRRTKVDANLVDERTYQALWDALESADCEPSQYRPLWQTLALVLYRFGLRRGEAHELTLADVHRLQDRRIRIRVSPSRLTSLKSRSSARVIGPVVLNKSEWAALNAHLSSCEKESGYRNAVRDVYLFARPGHGSQLLDSSTLFDPITQLLHAISGDQSLRNHHFRHGFASRLFAGGRSPLPEMDETKNRDDIWRASFRHDGGWLRAFELGHVSPQESVVSYCHTVELVHYQFACKVAGRYVPMPLLSMIAGLSKRSVERSHHRKRSDVDSSAALTSHLMLASVRKRWPLSALAIDGMSEISQTGGTTDVSMGINVKDLESTSQKQILFNDVLNVIRDHLCGRLDITHYESQKIAATQLRGWISVIDRLTAPGYLRKRQRQDRMPSWLIMCGERTLRVIDENIYEHKALLSRCLVGFGTSRNKICVDKATGQNLKRFLEHQSAELIVSLNDEKGNVCEVSLVGTAPASLSDEKLFLLVLAVYALTENDIDTLVAPYSHL